MGFGNARDFDGVDDDIKLGSVTSHKWMHGANDVTGFTLTILAWVKVNVLAFNDIYTIIDTTGSGSTSQIGLLMGLRNEGAGASNMRLLIVTGGGGGTAVIDSILIDTYPNDTDWHRIAWTWDQAPASANGEAFVDGVSKGTPNKGGSTPNTANSSQAPAIGELANNSGQPLDGAIALVAVFDVVLDVPAMDRWFYAHQPEKAHGNSENSLMMYVGAQSPEHDYSGDGFDGTVIGTTLVDGPPGVGGKGMGVI